MASIAAFRFNRELLPPAAVLWKQNLSRLSRPSRSWARTTCPLHHGDNPTAFSVNMESGGFFCHSCGAKGGDIVAFVQQRHKVDFKTAAMMLGAWDDTAARTAGFRREIAERQRQLERIETAAQKLAALEHSVRLECRDHIHECDRVLSTPGRWSEAQWQRAQAASVVRDEYLLPAYTLLCFGPADERARFVLHPELRDELIAHVRWAGYVRTVYGTQIEVLA